jgi:hypothetical protein
MFNRVLLLTNNKIDDPFLHSQLINIYKYNKRYKNITLCVKGKSREKSKGFEIIDTRSKWYFLDYVFVVRETLRRSDRNKTIVHIRGFVSAIIFFFATFLEKQQVYYIYDPRGAFILERNEAGSRIRYLSAILKYLEGKIISNALFTIVETLNLKIYFQKEYSRRNNYLLCYNSSSFSKSQLTRASSGGIHVCYLGSINYWHPLDEICRLFCYLIQLYGNENINFHFYTQTKNHKIACNSLTRYGVSNFTVDFCRYDAVERVLEGMDICVSVTRPTESISMSSSIKVADFINLGKRIIMTRGCGDFDSFFERNNSAILYDFNEDFLFTENDIENLNIEANSSLKKVLSNSFNRKIIDKAIASYASTSD